MSLPLNPPAMPYLTREMLVQAGVEVGPPLVESHGFWFWTYEDRPWYVGPYVSKRLATKAREKYLKLDEGDALRVWAV